MDDENRAVVTPLIDLLRRIPRDAWAEVTERNGWSYHTNIGKLVNDAADEIERLRSMESPQSSERNLTTDAPDETGTCPLCLGHKVVMDYDNKVVNCPRCNESGQAKSPSRR